VAALVVGASTAFGPGDATTSAGPARRAEAFPPLPAGYSQTTVTAGRLRVRLSYQRDAGDRVGLSTADARIAVLRSGELVYDGSVPLPAPSTDLPMHVFLYRQPLVVRDLDADGEPELVVHLFQAGAHCCETTRIYRYTGSGYAALPHRWGDPSYELRGRLFISGDDRFAYRFTDYADSGWPIQVFAYRRGRLTDVTRKHPELVRPDATRLWHYYLQFTRSSYRDPRGMIVAWAADEALLGRGPAAAHTMQAQAARGHPLDSPRLTGGTVPRGAAFVRLAERFLHRLGYR
jgi:hypothetical protein